MDTPLKSFFRSPVGTQRRDLFDVLSLVINLTPFATTTFEDYFGDWDEGFRLDLVI
jgi:hypothetical protein